jgi:RNA polymerase sigma factor (sigma-70 family)
MPTESAPRTITRELFRAVLGAREATDRDLLARFVRSRDEEAFAELVRRHGRMVLAVGRRVTGHPQDAEDAFQAAFLVLARRAGHLKRPDQLANWLYGVAYRTALEARALRRRRAWEQAVPAASEPRAPESNDDGGELRRVIDEELARIPDKYRTAIVMCDLEGLPRTEVALRLKIPEGTLSSRLAYGRKLLAGRLSRRGVTASASALAVAFAREAMANAVPRKLLLLTARSAAKAVPGGAVPIDLVSPSVSSITDGVMKAMLAYRLRLMIGTVLGFGLLGLGAVGFAQLPGQEHRVQPPAASSLQPLPADNLPGDFITQQPRAEKAEKVAAKGIEDDDVPLPATPSQAVVRVEDGKLIIRQRGYGYQHIAQDIDGQRVHTAQVRSTVSARTFDPADVSVFDMKGNRLQNKAWRDKFKNDVHALVAYDGRLPNPRELALFKDDALLVVLPAGAPGAATYAIPSLPGPPRGVYDPVVPRPAQPATPRAPQPENEAPFSSIE